MNMYQEAQTNLNQLYSLLQIGTKQDDDLYIQALITNNKIAKLMQTAEGLSKKERQFGRQTQKENQFKLAEAYSRQGNFKKMTGETEALNKLHLEDGEYAKLEENLNWLFDHKGLSAE